MGRAIAGRLIHLIWIMIAVSFLTFLLMYIAPGDAAAKKLNAQGIAVSEEILEQTRASMGLDRPFFVQYGDWALRALRGDLGSSYKDGFPVAEKLLKALGRTAVLTLSSLALALLIAIPFALLSALKRDSAVDNITRLFSFIGNSLPNFLISVLLMYFLSVRLRLLPLTAGESAKSLVMPCLALSIPICGRFIRQFRAELLEELGKPYVSGAILRGVKRRFVLKSVLHNAAIPMLTVVGLSVGTLMGGSVVIETIFRWPGLGKLAMDAITNRDYPVIQGFVLFTSTVYVVINLLIDICYRWIDPRLRKAGGDA
ncbi:MAG: ABC transporter permease [Clostridia bacterium]|nr:ABC transporter permease [Clostridia bacterium]